GADQTVAGVVVLSTRGHDPGKAGTHGSRNRLCRSRTGARRTLATRQRPRSRNRLLKWPSLD
ncbi:MAG: hypothetical protein AVDCRST_MAG93-7509, partial [uncultured Chloroflexia bacterium]